MRRGPNTDRNIRFNIFTPRLGPRRRVPVYAPPAAAAQRATVALKRYRLDLAAALVASKVTINGNFFWVTAASASSVVAQIQLVARDGTVSDLIDVGQGFRLFGVDYDAILVTSAAQAAAYLIITYGTDPLAGAVNGDTI